MRPRPVHDTVLRNIPESRLKAPVTYIDTESHIGETGADVSRNGSYNILNKSSPCGRRVYSRIDGEGAGSEESVGRSLGGNEA